MFSVFLNQLGKVDKTFFLICLIAVVVGVGIYFLVPVINRKQYKQARDNLKKREDSFKGNFGKKEAINVTYESSDPNGEKSSK